MITFLQFLYHLPPSWWIVLGNHLTPSSFSPCTGVPAIIGPTKYLVLGRFTVLHADIVPIPQLWDATGTRYSGSPTTQIPGT